MKPGMSWPLGVTVILGATVAANLWVMRIANADPAFAIEPDYYAKAVAFDSLMAAERRTLALGWGVDAALAPVDRDGHGLLTVQLRGADAAPLAGATVRVVARFNARANDSVTAVLREERAGVYTAAIPVAHAGEWEVRIDATKDDAQYSHRLRVTALTPVTAAVRATETPR